MKTRERSIDKTHAALKFHPYTSVIIMPHLSCKRQAAATFFGNGNNSSTIDLHYNNRRLGALLSSSLTAKSPNIEAFVRSYVTSDARNFVDLASKNSQFFLICTSIIAL